MIDVNDYDARNALEVSGVSPSDVAEVIHWQDGENDGDPWYFVVKLKNDLFSYGESWCDYSGWECRSGGESWNASDLDTLVKFRMTPAARRAFGYGDKDGLLLDI